MFSGDARDEAALAERGVSPDVVHNLIDGLTSLGNAQAIAYLVGGSLLGVFIGVIPGLGGAVVLSVILAFIYHLSLTGAICLFLAVHAASYFSASVTSILLNTPAHPEAFAVTFDGFPMAQRGEAGRALGISAVSTCVGGLVGCAALIGLIQVLNDLPSIFHPPEYVALISIALVLVGTLGTDAVSKALISAGLGLTIASIGSDAATGEFRYTFGAVGLLGGVSLVALALGLFAMPQMILVFGTATTIARQDMMGKEVSAAKSAELGRGFSRQVIGGALEALRHWVSLVVAGLIGVACGVIPGIGGFSANFLSYGVAQQMSRRRELFGTGIPEGIIAPEGSSLSKEAGSIVPIVGLGIPGGVGGALFIAALTIKGVKTGYGFAQTYPTLPYEMMWVIALGGIIGTLTGLLTAPLLARVTRVPGPLLVPFIMSLAVVGAFVSVTSFFTVMELLVFAIVGLVLRRLRYSIASFAIGLVLGPTFETNIYLTHGLYHGFTFLKRPLADVLFAIGFAVLIVKAVTLRREAIAARVAASAEGADATPRHHYPLLGLIASVLIVGYGVAFTVYGATHYDLSTGLMPAIGGTLAAAVALWRVPIEALAYRDYRRSRARRREAQVLPDANDAAATTAGALPPVIDRSWGRYGQYTREVVALGCLGGLILGCYLFGFKIAIPAFCAAYGLFATRRVFSTLRSRVTFAVLAGAAMWGATFEILGVLHLLFTPVVKF